MKTITATHKGIAINYADTHKSAFIPYPDTDIVVELSNNKRKYRELNLIQKNMYCRLMYGIKAYSPDQVKSMSDALIFTIERQHTRATDVVNQLKYERHYGPYNKLFKVIFPHIELSYFKDGKFAEMPTLKELKITTDDIIQAWIDTKLLPLNFFSLEADQLEL
jgi:hypothetical protein